MGSPPAGLQPHQLAELCGSGSWVGSAWMARWVHRLARELKLFRQIRAEPTSNRKLYHVIPVNRLRKAGTADERRALRRSGLTDEQIDGVSQVGMGADQVHELMLRGIGPRGKR